VNLCKHDPSHQIELDCKTDTIAALMKKGKKNVRYGRVCILLILAPQVVRCGAGTTGLSFAE
jgi:hypothetical protein